MNIIFGMSARSVSKSILKASDIWERLTGYYGLDVNIVTVFHSISTLSMFKHFVDHKPVSHIITRHWAKDAINTAIDFQWIDYTDQFDPDGAVTRMEMVDFVQAVFTWAKAQ